MLCCSSCVIPNWKYCLFQEFVLFLPLVSVCGTACSQLEPDVERYFFSPVPRHPNPPGFVGVKSDEAETCSVHQKVSVLDPCPAFPWLPAGVKQHNLLSWAYWREKSLWLLENSTSFSSPGVLVFVMGFWNSPKEFSELCTVKLMTAWEQSVGCLRVWNSSCFSTFTFTYLAEDSFSDIL